MESFLIPMILPACCPEKRLDNELSSFTEAVLLYL
jgi:hypothetical protein